MPREKFFSLDSETVGRLDLHKALHKFSPPLCLCVLVFLCAMNLHEMIRQMSYYIMSM